jgi:hypothetical protein
MPFNGRTIRKLRPIKVSESMSFEELMDLFKQPPVPADWLCSLNPDIKFVPPRQLQAGVLPELVLSIHTDDCESAALTGKIAKLTFLDAYIALEAMPGMHHENIAQLCTGWVVFKNFTSASWDLLARIVQRGGHMLKEGHIRTMTAIGLATNASAEAIEADRARYCGHCFNVSFVKTPSMPVGKPGLLEGTSAMYQLPVTATSPRVNVDVYDENNKLVTKTFNMPDLLSVLISTLLRYTQVINSPNGSAKGETGWPLDVKVTGWLGRTMVMNSLDSDASQHLSFYNRIMYMGWPCTTDGLGCMPVEEKGEKGIIAGCHPYSLSNQDLRGVDATLPQDMRLLMTDIMEEATPPMAPESTLRTLGQYWIPCRPLEVVNVEMRREPGVTYNRVVGMECPCAPEYLAIIHEAKRRFVDEANRINDARPDSDGIRLYSLLEGLSDLLCADVPNKDIAKLTIVDSAKQALGNLHYPGFTVQKVRGG